MDTVCMALTHSETRIAVVDNARDTVIVNRVYEEVPILPQIINGNLRDTITFFDRVSRLTKTKNAELLVSYPTNIGRLDCFESGFIDVDDYEKALPAKIYSNLFLEKKEQFYVDWVMDTDRGEGLYITAVAVSRLFVDTLFNGAKSAGYRRISVEPESLAVLRLINDWQNVSYILEVESHSSTLTSFNPHKGIIVLPLLNLGSDRILSANDGISSLCQQLTLADLSTSKTFDGLDRNNVNIYVTCSNGAKEAEITQKLIEEGKSKRIQELKIPDNLFKDRTGMANLRSFVVPLGLGLKPYVERMNDDETQVVSRSKPSPGRLDGKGAFFGKTSDYISFFSDLARRIGMRFGA